jgi:hypothetical protein
MSVVDGRRRKSPRRRTRSGTRMGKRISWRVWSGIIRKRRRSWTPGMFNANRLALDSRIPPFLRLEREENERIAAAKKEKMEQLKKQLEEEKRNSADGGVVYRGTSHQERCLGSH